MKEDEMKQLRCCGPQPYNTGILMPKSQSGITVIYLCSGSQCAGWEWETVTIGDTDHDKIEGDCGLKR